MAIAHFGFGAALTALVVLYLLPSIRYERVIVLFGGVWGMIPDVYWVLPVFRSEIQLLHGSVLADVFWLHRTLDVVDLQDSRLVGAVMLGLFIGVSVLADHWDYTQRHRTPEGASLQAPFRSLGALSAFASLCGIAAGGLFVAATLALGSSRGLFLGTGAALLLTGLHGLTTETTFDLRAEALWVRRLLQGGQFLLSAGGTIGGLALLAGPLRSGLTLLSASYAGLGALVLLQTTLLAHGYVSARHAGDKSVQRSG